MIDVNWNLAPEGAVALKQDVGRWKNVTWIHADGSWWDDTDATWNTGSAERDWLQTIAVRPVTQTKTVADAVEYYKGVWPYNGFDCAFTTGPNWNGGEKYVGTFELADRYGAQGQGESIGVGENMWVLVCTRAEFEAYVKEREGENWTHIDAFGDKCRILTKEKDKLDSVVILREDGHYAIPAASSLKPIKPTISSKEYDMLAMYAASLNVDPSEFDQYMIDNYDNQLKG